MAMAAHSSSPLVPHSLWQQLTGLFPNISEGPFGRGRGLRQAVVGGNEDEMYFPTHPNQDWGGRGRRGSLAPQLPSSLAACPGAPEPPHGATCHPASTSALPLVPSPPPLPAMHPGTHRSHKCRFGLCVTLAEVVAKGV